MIQNLIKKYPWPDAKPELSSLNRGWFSGEEFFKKHLDKNANIIIELGSWLGKSTQFFLNQCPNSFVIAIDHWKGSKEHQKRFQSILPNLYELFLVNCWEFKDRLIPIRNSTSEGLQEVFNFGIKPDFIYVDAGHSYIEVVQDILISINFFPHSAIGGDDWLWGKLSVQKAVKFCANQFGKEIEVMGNNWLFK